MERTILKKKAKVTLILTVAFTATIVSMFLISITAYPINVQVSRSIHKVALEESDLPPGNYQAIANYRSPSDISEESRALGWVEGYQVTFLRGNELIIQQQISIYPQENIDKVLDIPLEIEGWQLEGKPAPNIGDRSRMHLLTKGEGDTVQSVYVVEFIKGDTYSALYSGYEDWLIELSERAESKIPEFYVNPYIILALGLAAMYLLGLLTYHIQSIISERKVREEDTRPDEEETSFSYLSNPE